MQTKKFVLSAIAAVVVTAGASMAGAATLTSVPMQGGMVMPMVSYQAASGRVRVSAPAEPPQLTPLLVSNPGDVFEPAAPWFEALDPSRRGLSFSRRYGFVMDTMTDPLPADTEIRIRKLAGPADLEFYRYSKSAPAVWEPIFGTGGSSPELAWNGMMFHPGVAAPPGTNALVASFEAYLANKTTGQPVTGSGSGAFELRWSNVSDGRPAVEIGFKLVVAWPSATTGYVLESAEALASGAAWTVVTNTLVLVDGKPSVILEAGAAEKFYRMRRTP